MTSFEHNVMVALYWGGEIITDMNGFRYTECARMIISMSTSTNYVELVGLLHEKMGTNSENIHMDISGKYPCSIQVSGHHGYHMNLLAQNYGFTTANQPHFVEPIVQPPFQQLSMHGHRSFGEGSSSQMRIDNSHRDHEARDNETNVDLYNDEEDEPPKDGDESEPDQDIDDIRDFSQNGVNLHNHKQGVFEIQNHDIPYFRTLENEEDIFMSTCESEMKYCSDLSRLMWRATLAHQVRKFESLMWQIREENRIMLQFSLIGHEAYWLSPSFTMRSNEFYRRPNQPRTTRIPNKMDRGSTVYERACGLCRQTGHDRRRWPNQMAEIAWKDLNEGILRPTPVSMKIHTRILNLARIMDLLKFTSNQLCCHGVGEVRSEQLEEEEECHKEGMKKSRNQARGKITSTGIIDRYTRSKRKHEEPSFRQGNGREGRSIHLPKEEIALIQINLILVGS
ncbi:hypothetical protein H5410_033612, partial [Solanum commersonii]